MSDIALDALGDLEIVGGNLRLAKGAEAIAQDWAGRVSLFRGEWFIDRRVGIDYQNDVLVKSPRPMVLRSIFERVTRETAGVLEIVQLSVALSAATRELRVDAEVLVEGDERVTLRYQEVLLEDAEVIA